MSKSRSYSHRDGKRSHRAKSATVARKRARQAKYTVQGR